MAFRLIKVRVLLAAVVAGLTLAAWAFGFLGFGPALVCDADGCWTISH